MSKKGIIKYCIVCGKEKYIPQNRIKSFKCCSIECLGKTKIGKPSWNKGTIGICKPGPTSFKLGETSPRKIPEGVIVIKKDRNDLRRFIKHPADGRDIPIIYGKWSTIQFLKV
jgi:hypothetical protein